MLRQAGVWMQFRGREGRGNVQNLNGVVTPHTKGKHFRREWARAGD